MSQTQSPSDSELERRERWNKIAWPKSATELHVHLGGSVPLYRLWEIAITRGIRGMGQGYEEFMNIVKRQEGKVFDLDSYLEIYDRIELIQSGPQSIRESIIIAIHRAFQSGGQATFGPGGEEHDVPPLFSVDRLELRLNPLKRTGAVMLKGEHAGLYDVDRVIKAACGAVEDVEIGFNHAIQCGLLFCFGRDMTFEANMILARKIAEWKEREQKIIGVDLAGSERTNPLSDPDRLKEMKTVFDTAGTDIGRTVHVGETTYIDIETFLRTIETLEPQRVAHPITAFRAYWESGDKRGLEMLRDRNIICELCAKSNFLTGAVKDFEQYRNLLELLDEYGIRYAFSTDAPSLQVTSLASEMQMLFMAEAISEEQILRSFQVAREESFLPRSTGSAKKREGLF